MSAPPIQAKAGSIRRPAHAEKTAISIAHKSQALELPNFLFLFFVIFVRFVSNERGRVFNLVQHKAMA
jgi:hypothetical protein